MNCAPLSEDIHAAYQPCNSKSNESRCIGNHCHVSQRNGFGPPCEMVHNSEQIGEISSHVLAPWKVGRQHKPWPILQLASTSNTKQTRLPQACKLHILMGVTIGWPEKLSVSGYWYIWTRRGVTHEKILGGPILHIFQLESSNRCSIGIHHTITLLCCC